MSAAMPTSLMASSPMRKTGRARCPACRMPGRAELSHRGLVLLCFAEDTGCRNAAESRAAQYGPSVTSEIEIARTYFGRRGRAQRYDMVIVPPREPVRQAQYR